jgi:hypothetical protein
MPIWRYMSLAKFMSVLFRRGLYFANAPSLGDPFEGSVPFKFAQERPRLMTSVRPEHVAMVAKASGDAIRWYTQFVFVNCWFSGEHESAALWRYYTDGDNSICIRSDVQRLRGQLPPAIKIVTVKYIDFATEEIPELAVQGWTTDLLFEYKRKSYEHEREVRALYSRDPPFEGRAIDNDAPLPHRGEVVPVDLNALVTEVRVSPSADDWFLKLVQDVCTRFDLIAPVRRSDIATDPVY